MGNFPLEDKRIIVTNPQSSKKLNRLLTSRKAEVLNFPMIEISPNELSREEHETLDCLRKYSYIFFTSKNGVKYFFEYLKSNPFLKLNPQVKFYTIGEPTAKSLEKYGHKAHYINPGNTAKELVPYLEKRNELDGQNVLLVLGNLASNILSDALSEKSHTQRIDIYKTGLPQNIDQSIYEKILQNNYDLIIFTSPSAIDNLLKMSPEKISPENMKAACIGKKTEAALNKKGYEAVLTASKAKMEVLVNETEAYFSHHS